jgi:cytochrome c-type biogenesis protein CcmE
VNKRAKQRLVGVTILIFVAIGALIGFTRLGNAAATPVTIDAVISDAELKGRQIEVTGEVVAGSWISGTKPFVFEIEDSKAEGSGRVRVLWNDVVPGAFGDGTTATVTGVINENGDIEAKYLVTKCPSKYESATGALNVNDVLDRSQELLGSTLKVTGIVVGGSIQPAGGAERFRIADSATATDSLPIAYGGGLSEEFEDGVRVVITGSIEADGIFQATEVALDTAAK